MNISMDCCICWAQCIGVVCCFQQWYVEYSHTRRPGSGRPRSTDARQDRRIVGAAVAARTHSMEEIQARVAPDVSPRTIGNRLFAAGLRSRVALVRLQLHHDTAKHGYSVMFFFSKTYG